MTMSKKNVSETCKYVDIRPRAVDETRLAYDGKTQRDWSWNSRGVYVIEERGAAEAEFLFAPYSIFTVLSVEWGENGAPHRIELYAATDNRAQAAGGEGPWATPVGSEELPVVPWY